MRTIYDAIEDAKLNYVPVKTNISASVDTGMCACRGMCGSHTGPCTMQSSKEVKGTAMCAACSTAMSAGGPGSGRKPGSGKFNRRDVAKQVKELLDAHNYKYSQAYSHARQALDSAKESGNKSVIAHWLEVTRRLKSCV